MPSSDPEVEVDVAVIGLGIMGATTLWRLAARGVSCAGFDRHRPPHQLGQSKGETRIVRRIQFEGDEYVALVNLAYPLWAELESAAGTPLLVRSGLLVIGPPNSQLIAGGRASADRTGVPYEMLDASALRARYPQHVVADEEIALLDPGAGFVSPDRAVPAALHAAQALGAAVHTDTDVIAITGNGPRIEVKTSTGTVKARHVVVAAGGWLPDLLPELGAAITIERHMFAYVGIDDPAPFQAERFPIWMRENGAMSGVPIATSHSHTDRILAVGFPTLDGRRVRVGFPITGFSVPSPAIDPGVHPAEHEALAGGAVQRLLKGVQAGYEEFTACQYDNSPDFDFIIGPVPGRPGLTVIAGLSGHGFKHAPAIGEVAAALAVGEPAPVDLARFDPARLG